MSRPAIQSVGAMMSGSIVLAARQHRLDLGEVLVVGVDASVYREVDAGRGGTGRGAVSPSSVGSM
jgi:hypothetical protein